VTTLAVRLLADGHVVREAVFASDRALLVGRGPECDFVIVDPSVSRQHARLCHDDAGRVWVEDGGGRNGLMVAGARVERAQVPATGTLRCRLGAAELELALASSETTVELALPPPPPRRGPGRALAALGLWAAGVAAWVTGIVMDPAFWSPWEKERATGVSRLALSAAVILPVLAFLLVGLLRVVGRRVRLGQTLQALAVVSWGWALLHAASLIANYGLSVPLHASADSILRGSATAISLAYLASVGRSGPRRRFFAAWLAAAGLLVVAAASVARRAVHQTGTPELDYDVAVPIRGFAGPSADLDGYLDRVRRDFEAAARQAENERRELLAAQP
jgi:FHA domain